MLQVLHVMAGKRLLSFRVGQDGRLLKHQPGLSKMFEAGKDRVVSAGKDARRRAKSEFRKVVTGDPNKRIRDHMKEVPQVKLMDKLSFTLGVLCICATEWMALRQPQMFPLYYYTIMTILLINRYITYSQVSAL